MELFSLSYNEYYVKVVINHFILIIDRYMKLNVPDINILKAFGVSGNPILLPGGQGTSYLVDGIVLKPTNNEIEACWVADVYNSLSDNKFRVAKPVLAKNNSWVFSNWTAYNFIKGEHLEGRYLEIIEVSNLFHEALEKIPRPSFLDMNNDAWSIADKIAWGELHIPKNKLTDEMFEKIFTNLRDTKLPSQIIHGDIGGNILFDSKLHPAVIDFCPYWRPANFAKAISIIDWLVWKNADISIIDLCKEDDEFDQLLLRAVTRRTCEYIEHQKNNNKDYSEDIIRHINIVDKLIEKIE